MIQFSILVGISFMLVGALAYALPQGQESGTLVPALAGIVMACGSVVCAGNETARKYTMWVNAVVSGILIIHCAIRIVPDWMIVEFEGNNLNFIADVNVLGLSIAFLTMAVSMIIEEKLKKVAVRM